MRVLCWLWNIPAVMAIIIESTSRIKILRRKEYVYSGIEYSTSMAFLGPDDIYSYITELVSLDSSMPGAEYENNLFAAARHNERKGNIYHFELDRNRTGSVLKRPLVNSTSNVVTSGNEQVIFLQEDLIRSLIWKLDPTVIYMC
jgi:hypothetical protein